MEYIDLVMDNGELVRIAVPEKRIDEAHDTIENTMKRREWWSVNQWEGCSAEYMGHSIDRVNMGRVVAML